MVPEQKYVMTKSSIDSVKAIIMPVTMPGIIWGTTTLRNACNGGHPRSWAASNRFLSICASFGSTDKITYGKQNVTWAIKMLHIPKDPILNTWAINTNSSIIDTPVTISGFTMGKFVRFIITFLRHPRMR